MKISVVMATYNGEKYLKEQLDSIRMQTQSIDELIICDDGSRDNTVEIAREYIASYDLTASWKVVVNEQNLGYANNFDKVTLLATGDLIFFADQDDLWREDKVQIMVDIMTAHEDCRVLCTDYEPFYDGADAPAAPAKVLEKMPDNGMLEKISLAPKSVYIGALGCCMCVRRDFYQAIRKYWFDGWAQDDRMWRLSQCADGCYLLHSNLIQHRIHGNNTSTYGKYHTVEKRLKLFRHMQSANLEMKKMLEEYGADGSAVTVMDKHIGMMNHRITMLESGNILRSIPLVGYLKYYQELKSFLVEMYIIIKESRITG